MAIFNSYVELPEGTRFGDKPAQKNRSDIGIFSIVQGAPGLSSPAEDSVGRGEDWENPQMDLVNHHLPICFIHICNYR